MLFVKIGFEDADRSAGLLLFLNAPITEQRDARNARTESVSMNMKHEAEEASKRKRWEEVEKNWQVMDAARPGLAIEAELALSKSRFDVHVQFENLMNERDGECACLPEVVAALRYVTKDHEKDESEPVHMLPMMMTRHEDEHYLFLVKRY